MFRPSLVLPLLLTVLASGASSAQADESQLWLSSGVALRMPADLDLVIEPQLRLDHDMSELATVMVDNELRFSPLKALRFAVGYRAEYERKDSDEYVVRHRLHIDVSPRLNLGPVRLAYRLRLQEQLRPGSKDGERTKLRNRLGVSYQRLGRWTPTIEGELFHYLGDLDECSLDLIRLTASLSYDFTRNHTAESFYRMQIPQNDQDPLEHILGLAYRLNLHL